MPSVAMPSMAASLTTAFVIPAVEFTLADRPARPAWCDVRDRAVTQSRKPLASPVHARNELAALDQPMSGEGELDRPVVMPTRSRDPPHRPRCVSRDAHSRIRRAAPDHQAAGDSGQQKQVERARDPPRPTRLNGNSLIRTPRLPQPLGQLGRLPRIGDELRPVVL